MENMLTLIKKSMRILKNEGIGRFFTVVRNYIKIKRSGGALPGLPPHSDILFINGCDYSVPHPIRYRVSHQMEQLAAQNIFCNQVFYTDVNLNHLRLAWGFVIFRCPHTDMIETFIKEAKKLNKLVVFDIDDLVVDTKHTDTLEYVRGLNPEEKAVYDDGVIRMGKTLKLCDAATTTTEDLGRELGRFVPEVYINRNTASEEMAALSKAALDNKDRNDSRVRIAYFSGSLTHNEDFEMILPTIVKVMTENDHVDLLVTGHLDLPEALQPFENRVITKPFVDWQNLPELIASADVNLAPLVDTIFNACKSENKWVEAALVKVPTVASNIGAFKHTVEPGVTGVLCNTEQEWYAALTRMARDAQWRERIAEQAHQHCSRRYTTTYTGLGLAEFLQRRLAPHIVFVFPSLLISGGIYVALKHASYLREQGWDVLLVDASNSGDEKDWLEFEGKQYPVLPSAHPFISKVQRCVATMWSTVSFLENYNQIRDRFYLVQNYETDFYPPGKLERMLANRTYHLFAPIHMITISKWCQDWLHTQFNQNAKYAPNGIDLKRFHPCERDFSGKIRILIEGDCSSYYKNVDESFQIANRLDSDKYEIWYLSYHAEPKKEYRIDKFFHKVPFDEVAEVYRGCHILLKSSILESFSYPPLEMMATGGFCVVAPNGGNREYLLDEENCLLYPTGDIDAAIVAIERICADQELRERLLAGGLSVAKSRGWENLVDEVTALYQAED